MALSLQHMGMLISRKGESGDCQRCVCLKGGQESSLSVEEVSWVFRVLKSQIVHCLAVARLYLCKEGTKEWIYANQLGAVALITQSNCGKAHFLRLIDLCVHSIEEGIAFEQEIYKDMEYVADAPFFHSFEVDGYMAGLSFANEFEASQFYDAVHACKSSRGTPSEEPLTFNSDDSYSPQTVQEVRSVISDHNSVVPEGEMQLEGENETEERKLEIIDLLAFPQPLIPSEVRTFEEGSVEIADGISFQWKKNSKLKVFVFKTHTISARTLAEVSEAASLPKTKEQHLEELECLKNRLKRLQELRKNAVSAGDLEMASTLRDQAESQRREIKQVEELINPGKKRHFKPFSVFDRSKK